MALFYVYSLRFHYSNLMTKINKQRTVNRHSLSFNILDDCRDTLTADSVGRQCRRLSCRRQCVRRVTVPSQYLLPRYPSVDISDDPKVVSASDSSMLEFVHYTNFVIIIIIINNARNVAYPYSLFSRSSCLLLSSVYDGFSKLIICFILSSIRFH